MQFLECHEWLSFSDETPVDSRALKNRRSSSTRTVFEQGKATRFVQKPRVPYFPHFSWSPETVENCISRAKDVAIILRSYHACLAEE